MLKPLITSALSIAVLLAPLSAALTDLQPHCFGHHNAAQLASPNSDNGLHGVHHADCRWLRGDRNLLAGIQFPPAGILLAYHGYLPQQGDPSFNSLAFGDFSPRAPPLA